MRQPTGRRNPFGAGGPGQEGAAGEGGWGTQTWEGMTTAGAMVRVDGHGYADPSWQSMNNLLVRATLIQAIGRGRGVTEEVIPVVVVGLDESNSRNDAACVSTLRDFRLTVTYLHP